MSPNTSKSSAFTLVEVLVVIAIIAILMAILMPALRAARDRGARLHCASNTRTLLVAWFMYAQDHNYRLVNPKVKSEGAIRASNEPLPWVLVPDSSYASLKEKMEAIKKGALFPYVSKSIEVYRCPADQRIRGLLAASYRTYSIIDGAGGGSWPGHVSIQNMTEIKRPAEKYIFVEDYDPRGMNLGSWTMDIAGQAWVDPLALWHGPRTTLGFADLHVELHPWHDNSFIRWCRSGIDQPGSFSFGMRPPEDDRQDLDCMIRYFVRRSP
ncbi:MAG: prepilin-type N-terminal cleavage/methylation domain-containing protein [Sedimentisphaerales bacterium]|jgi:prepilin-type N-terminal cleavage/methylation domain-containing protein|nr:prepilin-type N-terminal cleavage/methylation domain-containing protein [Sedimentisphaerales bacterium]